jgi:hypothetical protein
MVQGKADWTCSDETFSVSFFPTYVAMSAPELFYVLLMLQHPSHYYVSHAIGIFDDWLEVNDS